MAPHLFQNSFPAYPTGILLVLFLESQTLRLDYKQATTTNNRVRVEWVQGHVDAKPESRPVGYTIYDVLKVESSTVLEDV